MLVAAAIVLGPGPIDHPDLKSAKDNNARFELEAGTFIALAVMLEHEPNTVGSYTKSDALADTAVTQYDAHVRIAGLALIGSKLPQYTALQAESIAEQYHRSSEALELIADNLLRISTSYSHYLNSHTSTEASQSKVLYVEAAALAMAGSVAYRRAADRLYHHKMALDP